MDTTSGYNIVVLDVGTNDLSQSSLRRSPVELASPLRGFILFLVETESGLFLVTCNKYTIHLTKRTSFINMNWLSLSRPTQNSCVSSTTDHDIHDDDDDDYVVV